MFWIANTHVDTLCVIVQDAASVNINGDFTCALPSKDQVGDFIHPNKMTSFVDIFEWSGCLDPEVD